LFSNSFLKFWPEDKTSTKVKAKKSKKVSSKKRSLMKGSPRRRPSTTRFMDIVPLTILRTSGPRTRATSPTNPTQRRVVTRQKHTKTWKCSVEQ
jgi:hypothetical protein